MQRATLRQLHAVVNSVRRSKRGPSRLAGLLPALPLVFASCLLFGAPPARAQTVQHTENKADLALKSDLRVDPSTLGMGISIPLASYPGRAGLGLPVAVTYSSKVLRLDYRNIDWTPNSGTKVWTEVEFAEYSTAGWTSTLGSPRVEFTGMGQYYDYEGHGASEECTPGQCTPGTHYVKRINVHMPDGSTHELRADDQVRVFPTEPFTGTFLAVDGTRMRFESNTGSASVLYLPDGSHYLFPAYNNGADLTATQLVDRHGNTLTYNAAARQWTDTLGRVVTDPLPQNPAANTVTYFDAKRVGGGPDARYIFRWKYLGDVLTPDPATGQPPPLRYPGDYKCSPNYYPQVSPSLFTSDFGTRVCVERDQSDNPLPFNPVVLAEVELPTGNKYVFTYNVYGEIDRVQLPTGGTESFTYAQVPTLSYSTSTYAQTNRGVVQRKADPGGGAAASVWSYAVISANPYTVRATAPDNSYSERLLHQGLNTSSWSDYVRFGFDDARAGMTYEERVFSPGGQMLRRTLSKWEVAGPTPGAPYGNRDPKVTKAVSILLDSGGSNALWSATVNRFEQPDEPLNLTSTTEYGYDASMSKSAAQTAVVASFVPANALAVRTTETAYLDLQGYRDQGLTTLPTSVVVRSGEPGGTVVAQSTTSYDEPPYQLGNTYGAVTGWSDPGAVRGDATTTRRWVDTTGGWVEAHVKYDQCGSVIATWDANGNQTQLDYSPAYAYAYPTSVTTPAPDPNNTGFGSNVGLATTTAYDPSTGLVTSVTDPNGRTTSYQYADPLNRLTRVDLPDGGRTINNYVNAHQCGAYVETRTLLDSSGREAHAWQFFDGLGRPYLEESDDGQDASNPYLRKDTLYDLLGRIWKVSNPYRTPGCGAAQNPSGRWTTTGYDALGRVGSVTTPDGAVVSTSYSGNAVTVTDQAGKKRSSVSDALGRIAQVIEDPAGAAYVTDYTYDVLGNLRRVSQGGQLRYFLYDSLSRLIRAKNPEQAAGSVASNLTDPVTGNGQWSTAYGYDDNGNLTARVDARNVWTYLGYDRLNRPTTVRYTDGTKDVDRHYDGAINGRGRFYYFNWDPNNNTRFDTHLAIDEYDAMGRVVKYRQHFLTNGVASPQFLVTYAYDKAGNVTSQTYPSGHTVAYAYDAAGRLSSFTGNLGDGVSRTYAAEVTYGEFGGVRQERFGTQTPLYHKLHYNARGQLYDIRLSSVNNEWDWNRGMLVNHYGSNDFNVGWGQSGPDNNGNVLRSHHYVPNDDQISGYTVFFQDYEYDALNRLTKVTETNSVAWQQQYVQKYGYDRWGNRTIDAGQTWSAPAPQFSVDPATNRLSPPAGYTMGYDAAGNLTFDNYTGQGTRTYDAEGRMRQAQDVYQNWSTYTYDAEGRRVKRANAYGETWQVYGAGGELLAEYRAGAAPFLPSKEYGYRGGELLVTMSSGDDLRLKRFVTYLYYGALHRDPTAQELQDTTNQLAAAGAQSQAQLLATAKQVARALFTQTAYETSPYQTETQYVADLYYAYLQRAPDDPGLSGWAGAAAGGATNRGYVCDAFQESSEFAAIVSTLYGGETSDDQRTETFIQRFYVGAYGRVATAAELQQWRESLNSAEAQGQTQTQAAAEAMGRALFAGQVNDYSITDQQYVTNLYEGFLQRGPDSGGLNFWTSNAAGGPQNRQNVLSAFATSPAFRELSATLYRETFWLVGDHLGTPRMVLDRTGSLAGVKRHDYLPFGEELSAGTGGRATTQGYGAADNVRQKFTKYERDSETGLDFAQARYYANTQGRFTGVDPVLMSNDRILDPQAINLYAYCANNPLAHTDPDGKYFVGTDGKKVEVSSEHDRLVVGENASDDLKRIVQLTNEAGSRTAMARLLATASSATRVNFSISQERGVYTDPVTKKRGSILYGNTQPHDKTGKPLTWSDKLKGFAGKPEYIRDDKGRLVYKEATITIYEGSMKTFGRGPNRVVSDPNVTTNEALVITSAHEETHVTDQNGVDNIRNKTPGFNPETTPSRVHNQVHREIQQNRNRRIP